MYTRGQLAAFPDGNAISVFGRNCACIETRVVFASSATWPNSNLAIYVPVRVSTRVVVLKLGVTNGSAVSGNFDLGVYDAAGTRLVSTGSTAQSGTSTEQIVDVTDTTIGPGLYYLAACFDNTTATTGNWSPAAPVPAANGVLTENVGSVTLPSTATFALNQTLAFIPAIYAFVEGTAA